MSKTKSGKYHTTVCIGRDLRGKRVYRSITADSVAMLKQMKAELKCSVTHGDASKIDFKSALDALIASKENVLSANTMKGYRMIYNAVEPLYDLDVQKMTAMDVQGFINDYASTHSPKSCANVNALIMQTIGTVREVNWKIKLPQKKKYDPSVPSAEHVKLMLDNTKGGFRLAIMLAAYGPMRRGEVCALRYKDIDKNTVHVHATITQYRGYEYKDTPKSAAGDRYIDYPKKVIKEIGHGDPEDYVVGIMPDGLYRRFKNLCRKLKLPDYRFHDLRVFGASWLHSLGYSNAYIMQRGGWETESTLVGVYRKNMETDEELMKKIEEAM